MKTSNSQFETFFVFNQIKHLVSTVAFECKMTKTIATTYQNLFGQNSLDNLEEVDLKISRDMCETMVKEKSCLGNKMTCIDGVCQSNVKLEKNFLYLQHRSFEVINCWIQERFLMTESLSEKLFGQDCVATDGGCSLDSNYIFWDKKATNSCHLNFITQTNVTKNGNFLISDQDNYIFRLVEKMKIENCGDIIFYKTNQDLYLSLDPLSKNIPINQNEIFDTEKLRLAEEDMHVYEQYENTKHLSAEICNNMKNTLKVAANVENSILVLTDVNGAEVVIYAFQKNLFILKCFQFKNTILKILDSSENIEENMCNLHVPVQFDVNNKSFKGLLDFNNIVVPEAKHKCIVSCDSVKQVYYLKNNQTLTREGSKTKLLNHNGKILAKQLNFASMDFYKLNFRHSSKVLESYDFQKQFKTMFNEIKSDTIAKMDILTDPNFKSSKTDLLMTLEKYEKIWNYVKWSLISTFLILMAGICFYYLKKFDVIECECCMLEWKHDQCKQCKLCQDLFKTKEKAKSDELEMKNLNNSSNSFESEKSEKKLKSNVYLHKQEAKSTDNLNKKSQTDSLIMVEFKDKISNVKLDENLCEIYPSSLSKKRRNAMDLVDGIPQTLNKSQIQEEYTSVKYSDH